MQYVDSRGVHRIHQARFDGREQQLWRAPGFTQRIALKPGDDGTTIRGTSQLNEYDQGFGKEIRYG